MNEELPGTPLASSQHELFAVAKAKGATNSNAIRAAGYVAKQPHQTGNALMSRTDVQQRIEELMLHFKLHPPKIVVDPTPEPTLEWVTEGYVRAIRMSEECGDRQSMISGLSAVAKLKGYLVDRTEVRQGPLDALSAEQLQAMIEFAEMQKRAITVEPDPPKDD